MPPIFTRNTVLEDAASVLWIFGGPDGSGRTTYAFRNLQRAAGTVHFVNLDEIARGLSPLDPAFAERDAARVALEHPLIRLNQSDRIAAAQASESGAISYRPDDLVRSESALERARAFIAAGITFAMETTLSGRTHFHLADEARRAGSAVHLQYFTVADPDVCLSRIARRVAEGGHDVPADVVRRRFGRSLDNLAAFAPLCDLWRVFDASSLPPRAVIEGSGRAVLFADPAALPRLHPAAAALAAIGESGPRPR